MFNPYLLNIYLHLGYLKQKVLIPAHKEASAVLLSVVVLFMVKLDGFYQREFLMLY